MSWFALSWASELKVGNSTDKLVLICLANFADENNQCYPSHKTISKFAEIVPQSVMRSLARLKIKGFISIEPRFQKTENNKNRQTSNLYQLNIPPCQNVIGVGNNIYTPPPIQKVIQTNNNKEIYLKEFEEFWNIYPRKAGSKKKAKELFYKVLKNNDISVENLIKSVYIFNKQNKNKEMKYIPHPTTWLNQERWETVEEEKASINLNQLVG